MIYIIYARPLTEAAFSAPESERGRKFVRSLDRVRRILVFCRAVPRRATPCLTFHFPLESALSVVSKRKVGDKHNGTRTTPNRNSSRNRSALYVRRGTVDGNLSLLALTFVPAPSTASYFFFIELLPRYARAPEVLRYNAGVGYDEWCTRDASIPFYVGDSPSIYRRTIAKFIMLIFLGIK